MNPLHLLLMAYLIGLGSLPFFYFKPKHDSLVPYEDTMTAIEANFKLTRVLGRALILWGLFAFLLRGIQGVKNLVILVLLLFAVVNILTLRAESAMKFGQLKKAVLTLGGVSLVLALGFYLILP